MTDRFYSFDEVCSTLNIEPARLRYYEVMFSDSLKRDDSELQIYTSKYSEKELRVFRRIKDLVIDCGFSVDEAKKVLFTAASSVKNTPQYTKKPVIITVCSGKGGVGKTFVAVNCALQIASAGSNVVIMDGDMGLANVHILCGLAQNTCIRKFPGDNFSLHDCMIKGPGGVDIISGISGDKEMAELSGQDRESLLKQIRGFRSDHDIFFIDAGAGISSMVTNFCDISNYVLVVTTPVIASIADAYGLMKTLFKGKPDTKILVVVNMVRSLDEARFVYNKLKRCCRDFLQKDIYFGGHIYKGTAVDHSIQMRVPLQFSFPCSKIARCITIIGNMIRKIGVKAGEGQAVPQ